MRALVEQGTYLAASILFILGLRSLTRPDEARRGMQLAAVGMLLAIVGTLLHEEILTYQWIVAGLIVGTVVGYPMGKWVPMTAMPQRIAFSHMFGALAATLVGIGEFYHMYQGDHPTLPSDADARFTMAALGFEVLFGALTVSGSFMAFGKLQEFITGRPVTFKGQNLLNGLLFLAAVGCYGWLIASPNTPAAFYAMVAISFAIGFMLVLPIGGADMPVVVSLLNSYAGLAASATGFAIGNNVLIIAGALDGASGFLLSIIMSKAMYRSFANVLFGAFGTGGGAASGKTAEGLVAVPISAEDAAVQLAYAGKVIVVPGYGMAVAQAQHQVRELAELIERKGGGEVRHPPRGGADAGAHERAAGGGQRAVRPDVRHGGDQRPVRRGGRGRGDRRERRGEPGGQDRPVEPDLRDAHLARARGEVDHRVEALDEHRIRRHRERTVL